MQILRAAPQQSLKPSGAVVDWIWRSHLVDAKWGGYINPVQFQSFVAEAARLGGTVNYISLFKYGGHGAAQAFIDQAAKSGVVVRFISLLPF
jgi:hypothetical protein